MIDFDAALVSFLRDYPWLAPDAQTEHPFAAVPRFRRTAQLLADTVPPNGRIVDVGAWPGVLTGTLRRLGWRLTAIDKATDRCARWTPSDLLDGLWRSSGAPAGLSFGEICDREGIDHHSVDIERDALPLADGSADAVVLTEVIEHLYRDPLFVLAEINRVLKPGSGVLVLSTPNLLAFRNRMNFACGRIDKVIEHPFVAFLKQQRLGHAGHVRLYAPSELDMLLQLHGFKTAFSFDRMYYGGVTVRGWTPPANGANVAAAVGAREQSDVVPAFRTAEETGVVQAFRPAEGTGVVQAFRPAEETSVVQAFRPAKHTSLASNNGGRAPRPLRILRKLAQPRAYVDKLEASIVNWAESRVPAYRPQMFVLARKIASARYDENCPAELTRVVRENR